MSDVKQWMPLYIGAYLRNTQRLTTEQHGAYILLMMEYWNAQAPLSDDDDEFSLITRLPRERWLEMRGKLSRFFTVENGLWRHERIDAEIDKAEQKMREKSERMAKARAAKAAKSSDKAPIIETVVETLTELPTPSPSPTPKNVRTEEPIISALSRVDDPSADVSRETPRAKGSRLPQDWKPPPEFIAWAVENEKLTEEESYREADKFRDYWCARSGREAVKIDWFATWRNRIRDVAGRIRRERTSGAAGSAGKGYSGPVDPVAVGKRLLRELADAENVPGDGRLIRSA